MLKKIGTLILAVSLVGCGGESSDKEQSAQGNQGNTPATDDNASGSKRNGGDKSSGGGRVDGIFTAGKTMGDMNKLKQVALAMHNHHDVFKQFPTKPIKSAKDKRNENLSWRVALLPFANFEPEFSKFDITQPWDSATNKPLAEGRAKDQFKLSNGNLICTIKHNVPAGRIRDIMDGTSNTIMLIENPNVSGDKWTQSVDLKPEEAVKLVKSLKKGEYLLGAFFDGATCKIYSTEGRNIPDGDIAALFGYNDLKPLNEELLIPGN